MHEQETHPCVVQYTSSTTLMSSLVAYDAVTGKNSARCPKGDSRKDSFVNSLTESAVYILFSLEPWPMVGRVGFGRVRRVRL